MRRTAYIEKLIDNNRLYVRFWTDYGKVIEFVVQYEIKVKGKWKPAMRFDNSHDSAPHKHTFYLHGDEQKVELDEETSVVLTQAILFLKTQYSKVSENFRNN